MILPSPDDPAEAPIWDNYIVAQAVQASLGLIPQHALAVGVQVDGVNVMLRFQLTELTESDQEAMNDIVDEFEMLVGDQVHVSARPELHAERNISPFDGIQWIFLARIS